MPVPPDYETNPPSRQRRSVGPAWIWVTALGVLLQGVVSFGIQDFGPLAIMGQQLFGAGLGAWVQREKMKRDDDGAV